MKARYYSINLNKASNQLDQFEQAQKRRKVLSLSFLFVVILAAMGVLGYKTFQIQETIEEYRSEYRSIEEKITQLEASSDYLSPEDVFALASITRERLTWSEKISVLGNILPKDVAITELIYDGTRNAFLIKGISKVRPGQKDLDLVVAIINLVKAQEDFSSDFSEIKFQSSQRVKYRDQEIVKFEIACLIKS
jgi:cell division protein FtsB